MYPCAPYAVLKLWAGGGVGQSIVMQMRIRQDGTHSCTATQI
jgi:hypothetical protein